MLIEEYIISFYDKDGEKIGFGEPITYYPTKFEIEYAASQSPFGIVFVEKFYRLEGFVQST